MAINITNHPNESLDGEMSSTNKNMLWIVFIVLAVAAIAYAVYAAYYASPTSSYDTRTGAPLLEGAAPDSSNNDATNPSNTTPPQPSNSTLDTDTPASNAY